MESTRPASAPSVLIIGAGFGGIAMALRLKQAGIMSFTILEKASDIGGVWRENTYPGAGCDIPSPLYSFSTEPNPDWPRRFSAQQDIKDYLHDVVAKHELAGHIRLDTEVTDAEFDEGAGYWRVRTGDGDAFTADVLVPAVGQLSRPTMPAIPGIDTFTGTAFHSACWDHDHTLAGQRVAVIGTGASAIQFVPAIQPEVGRLTVFQRSAPWVLPKADIEYSDRQHRLFRSVPITLRAERFWIWLLCEIASLGLVDLPVIRDLVALAARWQLWRQVPDRALRAKLAPGYPVGCKRGLFSNEYYPALTESNVDLVTTPITAITETGVRTADGTLYEVDVIIYGTGFRASEFLAPMRIHGLGGRKLADVWADGAHAYLGMTVPGFPNMFMMYGPNTNLGVGSIVYMLESQARYIVSALSALRAGAGPLDVRSDVHQRYDRALQARLGRSVWTACTSWYRDTAGRITNNWPGTVSSYRLRTRKLNLSDYTTVPKESR